MKIRQCLSAIHRLFKATDNHDVPFFGIHCLKYKHNVNYNVFYVPSKHFVENSNQIQRKRMTFDENPKDFNPQKVLLLRKITRYEYEKKLRPGDSEAELKYYVRFILCISCI